MRLLVVYRGMPWPISEGYHLRILHIFRRLSLRHDIHLLALNHNDEQRAQLPFIEDDGLFKSITMRDVPSRSVIGRLRTNLGLSPVSDFHAEYPGFAAKLATEVKEMVSALDIDAAYVFDPWADLWFSKAAQHVPTLLDVCDCRSLFYERRLDRADLSFGERLRTKQLLKRFRQYETDALNNYPMSTVVSPLDKAALQKLVPDCRVELIPNGVDLEMFKPLSDIEEIPGNLIIFGNMDFLPNYDAAIHFAEDILPLVRESHPEVTFTVVGTNPLPQVSALEKIEGVEVTGRVEDLKPYIQRATMLVAPMRFGAGIKNKVLESMAVEKPVVTNSTGVEAMHPLVSELLCLADNEVAFAKQVCDLLDDQQRRIDLGKRGRQVMADIHSWETAAEKYEALFAELARS
ncbi:MAG: glycosyltransferase [Planctomycetes bacterium]|nr:glycosyltransferase [Planctomycetota bacterium]